MTFFSMLRTLIIDPLKLVFVIIYRIAYDWIQHPGICIIFLSLAMNFLVLPLYKRADAVQDETRRTEARLAPGIAHIKKTFSGSERMMMLQTYYRQNHYSPLSVFSGSISLLLEIPFFIAAYQFLSNLSLLQGVPFGPIKDLGLPDQMIRLGSFSVNLLPILMTAFNFVSAAVYLKGFPLKDKIRTYGIGLVFLVLLYDSPAGLVFYWTLNNVFSLCKNLVIRFVAPLLKKGKEKKAAAEEEEEVRLRGRKASRRRACRTPQPDAKLFWLPAAFLTVLVGFYIPSVFLAASPQEFLDRAIAFNPLWYNVSALLMAAGFFLLWFGVFYRLASPKGKVIFERILLIVAITAAINYMFFGTDLGVLSSALRYEGGIAFYESERIINGVVSAALIALVLFLAVRFRKVFYYILPAGMAALMIMASMHTVSTARSLREAYEAPEQVETRITLSRTGQNVVVLFLDRMVGEYVPYLFQERPDLAKTYDGFTWYSNVISYGAHTNIASPALLAGYEYTPVEMNRRDQESMKDKHNEALKMLPVLFTNNGYGVTVCDPPYANYQWIPDLAAFDDLPEVKTCITKGTFSSVQEGEALIRSNMRNFFVFSFMKTMQLELQPGVYDKGNYLVAGEDVSAGTQIRFGRSMARGLSRAFLDGYEVLVNLPGITSVEDNVPGQALFFYNDAPHEITLLKEPEYQPAPAIDNREFDRAHEDRFTYNGVTLEMKKDSQMAHYQTDMATFLTVGKWLDYLRKEGVYDNTRIIIVSDHGFYLYHLDERMFNTGKRIIDTEAYYPLLMVKDFGATGFTEDKTFMTNADTAFLAVNNLIEDPKNPYTGVPITMDEKTAHPQYIMTSTDYRLNTRSNTYDASDWAIVHTDRNDRDNWTFITDQIVLKKHSME